MFGFTKGTNTEVPAKPPRRPDDKLKLWTNIGLLIAVAIGMMVVILHGGNKTSGVTWAGASLALGGLLGFLFGIPGRSQSPVQINQPGVATIGSDIGKVTGSGGSPSGVGTAPAKPPTGEAGTNGEPPPTAPSSSKPPANGNNHPTPPQSPSDPSNLEQVSDWVTKLLLGGGLTQLQQIPRMVWELSYSVAVGTNSGATGQQLWAEQSFAAGLLIYFFITGFFGGYLITKLQLGRRIR